MGRDDADGDRWAGEESSTDLFRSSSSSHREKGERKSSKRDRDKDKEKDRKDKDKSRSSKHSRDKDKDKDKGHGSSSSSRKRERSEELSTERSRDRSKERSGNHAKEYTKEERSKERSRDGDDHGDDGHKRRRRDDGKEGKERDDRERKGDHSSSSRSHKSKHREKEGRSRDKDGSGRKEDGRDGEKEKHRKSDKHRDRDRDKEKDKDRHKRRDREKAEARDDDAGPVDNGHVRMEVQVADGEEEGEVVFEPKRVVEPRPPTPTPAPTTEPATPPPEQEAPKNDKKMSDASPHTPAANGTKEATDGPSSPASPTDKAPPPATGSMEADPPPPETDDQAEEAARIARIAARAEERATERAKVRAAAAAAAAAASKSSAEDVGEDKLSSLEDPTGGAASNGSRYGQAGAGNGARETGFGGRGGHGRSNNDTLRSPAGGLSKSGGATDGKGDEDASKLTFKTKKQREQEALKRLEEQRRARRAEQDAAAAERGKSERQRQAEEEERRRREREEDRQQARAAREKEKELEVLRNQYLGVKKQKKKIIKPSEKFSKIFQFDWDASEDTSRDTNPLYSQRAQLNASFGRGYLAGIDMREQRKDSAFLTALMEKRQEEQRRAEDADKTLTTQDKFERERLRAQQMAEVAAISRAEADGLVDDPSLKGKHWSEKPLEDMGERDWRIFREDFDIRVKGGKAPLPLRFWEEAHLPSSIMDAIRELGYEKPSPIQRQAIPIGMERRDIIGIAETGSGKTAAFGIPMITYILSLEANMRDRVAEQGPLALIMAPTRELAIQIEEECIKFCKYAGLKTVCVVGGQDIETQAFTLRKGVEIIIGTPGRLNDCVEKHYLVLNQCNYVVLDEADRMIDMGFEEQVLAVLDAMGGTLKADDAEMAYAQEIKARKARSAKDLVRVTAMFSATMPPAVEKMAKKYLRYPAIVQIGDEDTGKNRRIDQRVLWMTESQKKTKVVELLKNHNKDDRVLIFINTKKNADMLGRQLEQAGFSTGVLHGGKTQDQREENLEMFRDGAYTVLVATDVASRGLDIPDVKEVINYELPNKIETYCHRIGRTGRAGKEGVATSFLTEHDEEIMFSLKEYLISTESTVPAQLQKHNAAQAAVGTRREDGTLVNSKRDTIMYSSK